MSQRASFYVHGTTPDEQRRLSVLNRLLNESSLREMALQGGERILDVGSGLGQFTRLMGKAAGPSGYVLGVERDEEQLAEAKRLAEQDGEADLAEMRQGDAIPLPLRDQEWGTFDLVHSRFLLEHVPEPLKVVEAMVRAARPGGRIILEDDDHELLKLWPGVPEFPPVWEAYMQTYRDNGNDPIIGRRLVEMLLRAGAAPHRNTLVFFGDCAGRPDFPDFVGNLAGILVGGREAILATGLSAEVLDRCVAAVRAWGRRDDASFWYARSWAEGRRLESG